MKMVLSLHTKVVSLKHEDSLLWSSSWVKKFLMRKFNGNPPALPDALAITCTLCSSESKLAKLCPGAPYAMFVNLRAMGWELWEIFQYLHHVIGGGFLLVEEDPHTAGKQKYNRSNYDGDDDAQDGPVCLTTAVLRLYLLISLVKSKNLFWKNHFLRHNLWFFMIFIWSLQNVASHELANFHEKKTLYCQQQTWHFQI